MLESVIAKWLWDNRQIIAMVLVSLLIAALLWWGFIHNPKIIKKQGQEISQLKAQVDASQKALELSTTINKEKGVIDVNTQNKINELQKQVFPRRSSGMFLSGGRL